MEATFYYNKSASNVVGKTLELVETMSGSFKQPFNVLDPTLQLSKAIDVLTYNYVYIPEVERYYYVTSQPVYQHGYYEISLHEDVLESTKTDFLPLPAIIARQQSKYNAYLNDSRYPVLNKQQVNTLPFPSGFSNHNKMVVVVNGRG